MSDKLFTYILGRYVNKKAVTNSHLLLFFFFLDATSDPRLIFHILDLLDKIRFSNLKGEQSEDVSEVQ